MFFCLLFIIPIFILIIGIGVVGNISLSNLCYDPEVTVGQYINDNTLRYYLFCEEPNPLQDLLDKVVQEIENLENMTNPTNVIQINIFSFTTNSILKKQTEEMLKNLLRVQADLETLKCNSTDPRGSSHSVFLDEATYVCVYLL